MAKDDEKKPTAAEKGKGKAVEGDAAKEVKKDKDGKPIQDDKKGVMPEGRFPRQNRCYSCSGHCMLTWTVRGAQRRGPAAEERTRHARGADTGA